MNGRKEEGQMQSAQAQVAGAPEAAETLSEGAKVIPLFRGGRGSEQPLVTLSNGLWRKVDVASYLKVSDRTVERYMLRHGLPHEKPFGKKGPVRFDPRRVQAWWEARVQNGHFTAGAGLALFVLNELLNYAS